jgi:VPDSG-CTERM motif
MAIGRPEGCRLRGWREVCSVHIPVVRLSKHTVLLGLLYVGSASIARANLISSAFQDFLHPQVNPSTTVPDGGMTAILLGGALAVIAVLRRFVKR